MMDDLRIIVEMISKLPTMAVWVLLAILFYKVSIVGSVYGVIRFAIQKITECYKHQPTPPPPPPPTVFKLGNRLIDEETGQALVAQVMRLSLNNSGYIHTSDVQKLRVAIDALIENEKASKK